MRKDGPELASMLTSVDISVTQYTDVIDTKTVISSRSIDNNIKKTLNCLKQQQKILHSAPLIRLCKTDCDMEMPAWLF